MFTYESKRSDLNSFFPKIYKTQNDLKHLLIQNTFKMFFNNINTRSRRARK
jgi:hypothetical protein